MDQLTSRRLLSGELESTALAAAGLDCYAATSLSFDIGGSGLDRASPFVDTDRLEHGSDRPAWPGGAPYAVCLTHDVDEVSALDPRVHARRIGRRARFLVTSRPEARAFRAWRSSLGSLARSLGRRPTEDPLHRYERWLDLEAEFGAKSTFLFLPDSYGRVHYSDGGYRFTDKIRFDGQPCTVAEMMREIHRRGWEVGLHGSWYAFDSVDGMKREREQVTRAIDAPVVSVRQHNLHFDVRCSPRVCRAAGLQFDSSLGFNDGVGFRMGTSWPWDLLASTSGSDGGLLELPLVIQDKCLIADGRSDVRGRALDRAIRVASRVEDVGGVLTLLWHPNLVSDDAMVELYRALLAHLRDRGAWFGTMVEVGRWWRANQARPERG